MLGVTTGINIPCTGWVLLYLVCNKSVKREGGVGEVILEGVCLDVGWRCE